MTDGRLVLARRQHGVVTSAQLARSGGAAGGSGPGRPWVAAARCTAASTSSGRSRRSTRARWPPRSSPAPARCCLTTQPPFSGACARHARDPMRRHVPDRDARSRNGHHASTAPRSTPRTAPAATASPSPPPPAPSSTSPRTEPPAEVDRALNEARIARPLRPIPSMSSSAVTRGTEDGGADARRSRIESGFTRSRAERLALELIRQARPAAARDERRDRRPRGRRCSGATQRLVVEIDGYAVPLDAPFVRARPPQGAELVAAGLAGRSRHLATAEPMSAIAVVARLATALAA